MGSTRRQFVRQTLALTAISNCIVGNVAAEALHCTPAPTFPVPLSVGSWRSQPFPVGKHEYHVSLYVKRLRQIGQIDCALGPKTLLHPCETTPLLDIDFHIWDGDVSVKRFIFNPIEASAWAQDETECMLGTFKGKRNGMFVLELNVKKDPGFLKELQPRIEIVKTPGYWCWL